MKNNFGKNILTYFREYCDCTSVHGFRYLGEKRTLFEKIWWFLIFSICLSTCIFSIFMVYKKWEQSPVIVSFANRGTPIYKIPFPAVTICPETKSNREIFNYTKTLNKKIQGGNLTETENLYFEYMLLICTQFYPASGSNESTYGEEFFDTISKIHPKFNMRGCKNQGKSYNCTNVFKPIFTEEGICFTFNMLDRSEIFRENVIHYRNFHQFNKSRSWSVESGYSHDAGLWTYPQRALLAGAKNGFTIQLLTSKSDLDFLCRMGPQGFKVLIHSPASFPTPSQEYFRVPLDQTIIAEVQPTMINTSDSVRAYSKDRRRCYFQTERYLQYFKIYNKVNCEIECLANFTLDMCGCVNFFMPRDNSTNVCGATNLSCMNEAESNSFIKLSAYWHLENGYIPNAGLSPYPLRAYLSGVLWGLSFKIVTPKQDLDYACKNSLQGYKVLLHTPMTIPRPNQKYFRIPLDQSVVGAVQPVMITTSETIKAYNPQRRKCYFAAERKLQFFQDYSASNCKLECLANWTSDLCDCVNFFMPRDNETEICGIGSLESLMHMVDLSIKIEKPSDKGVKNFDCDCLPICSDLTYEVETSQTNWEWDKWLKAHRNLPRINNSHFSALTLFFKSDNFITSERNELYGPTDFLANFGGLLGLFTGFSVLSLMEIFYHTHAKINVLVNPLGLHNVAMIRPEMTVEKEQNQQSHIFKYFKEYNDVTGIHGLRYITERRSTFEKIFWTNIVLVSLACCLYMIYEILQKYQTSPVVVNFSTIDTPVYEFPFPSVTICPESKYSSKKFNFTQIYFQVTENNKTINYDKTELLYFNYVNLLCDKNFIINNGENLLDDGFYQHIQKLAPEIEMDCEFMGVTYDCKNIFTPVITDQGICYSFNILDRERIFTNHVVQHDDFYQVLNDSKNFNTDSGYDPESGINTYPRRALMSGALNSLDVYLKTNSNDTDYICSAFMQGFRILIHNPWDVPRLTQNYFRVPIDKIVTAAINPELILTSEAVQKFSPETRQCYLSNERSLRHFKVYTQSNCLLECLTNYTLQKCGCVNYFMPRDNLTRICGSGNVDCMEEAENELKVKNFGDRISEKTLCDCKPPCTSLMYGVETSHSDFYWREYFKIRKRHNLKIDWEDAKDEDHWSIVSIFFKAEQFKTLERNELYGVCDLIANLGGLLGLFTGFSLITLVEIIYFLTLRIWCNYKLFGHWSGGQN
ncbi:uncharacterized protein LOC123006401 [Tribolium madens]|uniref:uncharacterized protein LOC123006401 n=1 Tax=Tribolium madens TaxID=41895 RepID=UPI001CF72F6A|nr:uncharacterized protein LOC123006401 [Tribolium madens]